jgi:hypothetical protein
MPPSGRRTGGVGRGVAVRWRRRARDDRGRRRRELAAPLVLLAVLAGCDDEGVRRASSDRVPSPPAAERAGGDPVARSLPRVAYRGGPFLRHPRIVTVTFAGDHPGLVARLGQFGDTVTRSGWWRAVTAGYCTKGGGCVGHGRPGRQVRLARELPARLVDVEVGALLERRAKAGRLGRLDADTLVVVYLPQRVALSDAFHPRYCTDGPRALHRALRLGRLTLPYAVVPRCGAERQLTASASQEILEATTNPDPAARGFAFEQGSQNLGFTAAGVEPVDPCGIITPNGRFTLTGGFAVQRAWSNQAAARGRDPCIPAPPGPYLALVPRHPTVRLPHKGASVTITLDAVADPPAPAWKVGAFDLTGRQDHRRYVELSLDRARVAAGQTAKLTVTVREPSPKELIVVGVVSTLGRRSHIWPLAIVMR